MKLNYLINNIKLVLICAILILQAHENALIAQSNQSSQGSILVNRDLGQFNLPFGTDIQFVDDKDSFYSQIRRIWYERDSAMSAEYLIRQLADEEKKWELDFLYAESQLGWTTRSQIFTSESLFTAISEDKTYSGKEILKEFASIDSCYSLDSTLFQKLEDVPNISDRWHILCYKDGLLIQMYRNSRIPCDSNNLVINEDFSFVRPALIDDETYWESYTYHFKLKLF